MTAKFIVIEGMDGSGTTTQVQMLYAYLAKRGLKVFRSAEPTDSEIGQECRRMLKDDAGQNEDLLVKLALSFAADRMHHVHYSLRPALKECDVILLDRYVLSSLVYQGLHLPTSFVKEINRYALEPDITLVLDLDAASAFERLSQRVQKRDFYEDKRILEKIRSRYVHFVKADPRGTVLIDASDSVDQVHSHLVHVVLERLAKV
jgi:dTMP kinase